MFISYCDRISFLIFQTIFFLLLVTREFFSHYEELFSRVYSSLWVIKQFAAFQINSLFSELKKKCLKSWLLPSSGKFFIFIASRVLNEMKRLDISIIFEHEPIQDEVIEVD